MSLERDAMHPVLQAAIDNPRFPTPIDWGSVAFHNSPRMLPVRDSNLAELVISGVDTLVLDNEGGSAACVAFTGPNPSPGIRIARPKIVTGIGAPITGRPVNDNEKGLPWPLYDEYVAERLGKDIVENSKNWATVIWLDRIFQMALLPDRAIGPVHWFTSGMSDEERSDGYETENVVPPNVDAVLHILGAAKKARLKAQGYKNKEVGVHEASAGRNPELPTGVEIRVDTTKILRLLQIGMRALYEPVKHAIVDHTEMWKLGITQGVSRQLAPTAGRQRVVDGLRIAADIRKDVEGWERNSGRLSGNPCSPLGRKAGDLPPSWRTAANDNCRREATKLKICDCCARTKTPLEFFALPSKTCIACCRIISAA